jgi:hypothetical protein
LVSTFSPDTGTAATSTRETTSAVRRPALPIAARRQDYFWLLVN